MYGQWEENHVASDLMRMLSLVLNLLPPSQRPQIVRSETYAADLLHSRFEVLSKSNLGATSWDTPIAAWGLCFRLVKSSGV